MDSGSEFSLVAMDLIVESPSRAAISSYFHMHRARRLVSVEWNDV